MTHAPQVLAASLAIADVLTGPPRTAVVIHRSERAAYLRTDDDRIVCFETDRGIGLPIAATVDDPSGLEVGSCVRLGGRPPARWWSSDVAAVRLDPGRARRLDERLDAIPPPSDPHEAALVGRPIDEPHALVGLGPGLTPAGDDLLAGALVALYALGRRGAAADLCGRVDGARTTPISAALLDEAGRGRAARPLLGLLDALGGRGDLDGALDGLLAVGATSGRWLADGVRQVIRQL